MNYKLYAFAGSHFNDMAKEAKRLSAEVGAVEFDFNGVTCLVDESTNLEWLLRDYHNAHLMEWKNIGPKTTPIYDFKTTQELVKRKEQSEIEAEKERKELKRKDNIERELFAKKIEGVSIELIDKEGWDKTVSKNTDPYGKCAIDYAEGWAKLMQVEIVKGKTVIECAEETSHELSFLGITGFMYGCAVNILSKCWKHGEDLRKWHNKDYGHDGDGVVNPAVVTIGTKT